MHTKTRDTIKNINDEAEKVNISHDIPLARYINSGQALEKTSKQYIQEGNIVASYFLLTKLLTLFVEKLRHHKEYKNITAQQKQIVKNLIDRNFSLLEKNKLALIKYLDQEYTALDTVSDETNVDKKFHVLEKPIEITTTPIPTPPPPIYQFREVLIEEPKSVESLFISEPSPPSIPNFLEESRFSPSLTEINDILPAFDRTLKPVKKFHPPAKISPQPIHRKIVDRKTKPTNIGFIEDEPLALKKKTLIQQTSTTPPIVDRRTKSSIESKVENILNSLASTMRQVVIPSNLVEAFLTISQLNNKLNRETCGILAGKASRDRYTITHLLVPKQTGSSDSCNCDNEEDILIYQDTNNLITLGWIHTHPSQSCFLSSIDMHTQYGYQCLLAESIAVVVSIKYNDSAVYSLTKFGLSTMGACTQRGFHLHENAFKQLFDQSSHTIFESNLKIKLIDLRIIRN